MTLMQLRQLILVFAHAAAPNAAALALLDAWYATPDARPPGCGDTRHPACAIPRLQFREEARDDHLG